MRTLVFLIAIIPIVSFTQNDSTRFIDNFYLELNAGAGCFNYSYNYNPKPTTSPNIVINESLITGDLEFNVCFRNKFFKSSLTFLSFKEYFFEYLKSASAITIGGNLLAFSIQKKVYFGPYITYGRIRDKLFSPRYDYLGLGIDLYIRKFHLDFYYAKVLNIQINTNHFDMKMYGVKLGYAFNLESFQKKK